MTDKEKYKMNHCIGFLPYWMHKNIGVTSNRNLFLKNDQTCEISFPDIMLNMIVEYPRS